VRRTKGILIAIIQALIINIIVALWKIHVTLHNQSAAQLVAGQHQCAYSLTKKALEGSPAGLGAQSQTGAGIEAKANLAGQPRSKQGPKLALKTRPGA